MKLEPDFGIKDPKGLVGSKNLKNEVKNEVLGIFFDRNLIH